MEEALFFVHQRNIYDSAEFVLVGWLVLAQSRPDGQNNMQGSAAGTIGKA
jgi:hypothetical protein